MPYSAITYRVKPGHEDDIAAVFRDFRRVDTPVLRNADGEESGRLLGTAVFIKDDVMVRLIHYEGSLADVARHIAVQPGVKELEQRLVPYLAEERRTATPGEFAEYFRNATMRCITQLSVDTHPAVR